MAKNIIVSPSGNLYGSEQVLLDFLKASKYRYQVLVPPGLLAKELSKQVKHPFKIVRNWYWQYCLIALSLLFHTNQTVYINEGGHIRYIKLLAKIFKGHHFTAHIRILEDTSTNRLKDIPLNISFISTSNYITENIPSSYRTQTTTIHDLYIPFASTDFNFSPSRRLITVGRLSETKGISEMTRLLNYLDNSPSESYEWHFYGDIHVDSRGVENFLNCAQKCKNIKCYFHGRVPQSQIYNVPAILLHFNKHEALGRIALEAIDHGIPFIGFSEGGIGEIGRLLSLTSYLVDGDDENWPQKMADLIDNISTKDFSQAKVMLNEKFSPLTYTAQVEQVIRK